MPMTPDAKGPMTMRQAVISYECGTGHRRAVAKKKKGGKPNAVVEGAPTKQAPSKPKVPKAAQKSAESSATKQ
jgi:hypothetical protein